MSVYKHFIKVAPTAAELPEVDMCEITPLRRGSETLHGVFVSVSGCGVLIIGDSGIGKSECALELVSKGHKLVADDVVEVEKWGNLLIGKAPERFVGLLEIRGLGIIDIRLLFGEKSFESRHTIDLYIELREKPENFLRIGNSNVEFSLLGVVIPRFVLSPDRNLSMLIETAVKLIRSNGARVEDEIVTTHNKAVAVTA